MDKDNPFYDILFKDQISHVVTLALGFALSVLYREYIQKRGLKSLWSLKDPDKIIFCLSTNKVDTTEYWRASTGVGQVRALTFLIPSLQATYGRKIKSLDLPLSEEQSKKNVENDLLILGGPRNNKITKLFFEHFPHREAVHQSDDSTIHWGKTGRSYRGDVIDGKPKNDFGIVIKMKNFLAPNTDNKIFLFSGSHTFGTAAAAEYFCKCLQKDLNIKADQEFAVLISCIVHDDYPIRVKKEDIIFFNESN